MTGIQSAIEQQSFHKPQGPNQSIYLSFNLSHAATDVINLFPDLGGAQLTQGYSVTAGHVIERGNLTNNISFTSSRNDSRLTNHFTNAYDVATQVGVLGPSMTALNPNPANYGLPNLVFSGFNGLSQTQPNFQLTQTSTISESGSWSRGRHNLSFGGDVRRVEYNVFGGVNATGSFIFTGGYTQEPGTFDNASPVTGSGSSFADFLLGWTSESTIESPYQKAYMRQNAWDVFVRDYWRVLPNLTLIAGVRYDYFSPYAEKSDRLATLDYNSTFTEVGPVLANGVGPITGAKYPRTLINPERNNVSPHIGLAWQPLHNTVVRGGYGIYYTTSQYTSFVQGLAYQPPFANVQANFNLGTVTLGNGFDNGYLADFGNYAVNRNYRLPYVQIWNLEVQQTLPLEIVLEAGYCGAKGTRLDVITAPGFYNNQAFPNAFFDFEDTGAFSSFNALIVRANKRLQNGLALQATYTYSHSIDDASSINAGTPVVAQNWQDILAEESNSSFDVRQQIIGSFVYDLPFGPNRQHLVTGWTSHALSNWSITGNFILATGVPLTPAITTSVAEIQRGTHGSVRPNRVPGTSIREGGGHINHWFNTAAFSTNFAPGQYFGTASRYSIPGPGTTNVNISLSKVIPFKDAKSLELRATATNALNIVQYAGVNTLFDLPTVGQVTSVQSLRQISFLARYRF